MVEATGWYTKAEGFRSQVSGIESVLERDGLELLFSQARKLGEIADPVVVTVRDFDKEKCLEGVVGRFESDLSAEYSENFHFDPDKRGFSDLQAVRINWTSFPHRREQFRLSNSIQITRDRPHFVGGYPSIDIKTEKRTIRRLFGRDSLIPVATDVGEVLESRSNAEILLIANKLIEKYITELLKGTTAAQTD